MTSQPIWLSINFMTVIPSLTFADYEWFPWSICNGCGMPAGNAYHSGHLVPFPFFMGGGDLHVLQLLRPVSPTLRRLNDLPKLTFTELRGFHGAFATGVACQQGALSKLVGLACAPIVETRFFELAISLLDFSPRIPLGTFSIYLIINDALQYFNLFTL